MKWILLIFALFIFESAHAIECASFVGHWEGQCHADDKDGLGEHFDYDIEIAKLSECQGYRFLGQDVHFNKVTFTEWNRGDKSFAKHGSLRWIDPTVKKAVEIFSSVTETTFTSDTKEIVQTNSYRNNFMLELAADGKLALTVRTQKNFDAGERYVCSLKLRN